MQTLKRVRALAATLLVGVMITGTASAAPVLCKTVTNNHMLVDSAIVSTCLDAGVGNLTGNQRTICSLTALAIVTISSAKTKYYLLQVTTKRGRRGHLRLMVPCGALTAISPSPSSLALAAIPTSGSSTRCNHCWLLAFTIGTSSKHSNKVVACLTSTSTGSRAVAKFQSLARSRCWAWPLL